MKTPLSVASTAIFIACTATTIYASPPLMDRLEYSGETTTAWPEKGAWLPLPSNERIDEIRRTERCSAIGAPRAKWRIADNRLWLTGLFKCGADISLASVFGGSDEPIHADWISGNLVTYRGKRLCRNPSGGIGLHERTLILRIERGLLVETAERDNSNHPDVPTVEQIRSWLRDRKEDEGAADSLLGIFDCGMFPREPPRKFTYQACLQLCEQKQLAPRFCPCKQLKQFLPGE